MNRETAKLQALEDRLNEFIERSRAKDAKKVELQNQIKQRDERIRKIKAQNHNMKKFIDGMQITSRNDSNVS